MSLNGDRRAPRSARTSPSPYPDVCSSSQHSTRGTCYLAHNTYVRHAANSVRHVPRLMLELWSFASRRLAKGLHAQARVLSNIPEGPRRATGTCRCLFFPAQALRYISKHRTEMPDACAVQAPSESLARPSRTSAQRLRLERKWSCTEVCEQLHSPSR